MGLHRFYLYGRHDLLGWLLPIPTTLGLYGIGRAQEFGLDDKLSWALIPVLGLIISASALRAIVYGLTSAEHWNCHFNSDYGRDEPAGQTGWLTIGAVVCALMIGTTILLSSIVFSFQHIFEYQIGESQKLDQ